MFNFITLIIIVCGILPYNVVYSVKITSYIDESAEKVIKLQSNPEEYRESIFIVKIQKKSRITEDTPNELFIDKLNKYLLLDKCILLKSADSETNLVLKIHCNNSISRKPDPSSQEEEEDETKDDNTETDDNKGNEEYKKYKWKSSGNREKDGLDLIPHTLSKFIYLNYAVGGVLVDQNVEIKNPHFMDFYGNFEHINQILSMRRMVNDEMKVEFLKHNPYLRIPINYEKDVFVETSAPWGLDRIDQRFGPLDGQYHYISQTASPCKIFVVDTGILTTHLKFGGRASFGFNAVGDGINTDCNGHGTHVAGIIVSTTYGVDQFSNVIAVKVLDCTGNGDLFAIQAGIDYILETVDATNDTCGIINLSLGGTQSTLLDDAILSLTQRGLFVSVSAGNEGSDACNFSPADLGGNTDDSVVSVGASDSTDSKPSWSNFGSCVTISAPGASIVSLWFTSNTAIQVLSGTSMSSPVLAGVASLVWKMNTSLTSLQVKHIVLNWATPSIISGTSPNGGAKNLVYSLITDYTDDGIPPPVPTFQPTNPPPVPIPISVPNTPPIPSTPSLSSINTTHGFILSMLMIFVLLM